MGAFAARAIPIVLIVFGSWILWSNVVGPTLDHAKDWAQEAGTTASSTSNGLANSIIPPVPTRGPTQVPTNTTIAVVANPPAAQAGGNTNGYTTEELLRAINEGSVIRVPYTPTPIPTATPRAPLIVIPGPVSNPCIHPCATPAKSTATSGPINPPAQTTPTTQVQSSPTPCAICSICNQPSVQCITPTTRP